MEKSGKCSKYEDCINKVLIDQVTTYVTVHVFQSGMSAVDANARKTGTKQEL